MEDYRRKAAAITAAEVSRLNQQDNMYWKERAMQAEQQLMTLLADFDESQQQHQQQDDDMHQDQNDENTNIRITSQIKLDRFLKATQKLERIKNNEPQELINVREKLRNLLLFSFLPMVNSSVRNACIQLTVEQMLDKVEDAKFHVDLIRQVLQQSFEASGVVEVLQIYVDKRPVFAAIGTSEHLLNTLQLDEEGNPKYGIQTFIGSWKCFDALDGAIEKLTAEIVSQHNKPITELHQTFLKLTEIVKQGLGIHFAMVQMRLQRTVINFVTKFEELEKQQDDSIVKQVCQMMKKKVVPQFVLDHRR
eukprot:TRINITY_DN2487_c0_g2_i1.p1 TRINITY_DN2487_c0_g2~~TRINITY_DN2487_c0_g2_i1.p1  ORF type:complete len:306 (+),score=41.30 TRINITY_DN2487_c0_g2_i1:228-1145(+)